MTRLGPGLFIVFAFLQRHKLEFLGVEVQLDGADRTITVFTDNQVSDVLTLSVGIVIILAVDEHDDVGILLDRAGLS